VNAVHAGNDQEIGPTTIPTHASSAILVEPRKTTEETMLGNAAKAWNSTDRRQFIGGSDARIIMGQDGNASIHVHRRLKNPHKS
jgi:hypothetical protein